MKPSSPTGDPTPPTDEDRKNPGLGDPEIDEQDDAIIGRAFRMSSIVIGALVVVVAVAVWWSRRAPTLDAETKIETEAPVTVVKGPVDPPALPFTDITEAAGIRFEHENGATGEKLLPETMGSGAAFFDFDLDGDADLFLANGTAWPHTPNRRPASCALYRNDGLDDAGVPRFVDVTAEAGLQTDLYAMGIAIGDVDGNGRPDIFLSAVGKNRLYLNFAGPSETQAGGAEWGHFVDVSTTAGVAGGSDDWSSSAAFLDYDADGDLDLFVGNYVRWSREIDSQVDYRLTGVGRAYGPPVNYEGTFSFLYRNDGFGRVYGAGGPEGADVPTIREIVDKLRFTDVSAEAGIQIRNPATGAPVGKALGLAPVDLDQDGYLDILVANDTVQNFLFHNRGDGTFEEIGELSGVAYGRSGEATGAMGIDSAYYRNDLDLGFAIGNFANEMTSLYMSQGEASLFVDEAITDGIGAASRTLLTFGLLFLDLDLDGRLDILATNGHLENEIGTVDPSQSYEQPAQVFWNAGPQARASFVDIPLEKLGDLAEPIVGRASAYADIDLDGDLDVLVTQTGRRPRLLRNDQATGHHWIRLALEDFGSANRQAIGAWVEAEADGVSIRRQVMPTRGYLSQSELAITFGLGTAESLDRLEILWPDGTRQQLDPSVLKMDEGLQIGKAQP